MSSPLPSSSESSILCINRLDPAFDPLDSPQGDYAIGGKPTNPSLSDSKLEESRNILQTGDPGLQRRLTLPSPSLTRVREFPEPAQDFDEDIVSPPPHPKSAADQRLRDFLNQRLSSSNAGCFQLRPSLIPESFSRSRLPSPNPTFGGDTHLIHRLSRSLSIDSSDTLESSASSTRLGLYGAFACGVPNCRRTFTDSFNLRGGCPFFP
jgi:hypothetical protein